MALPLALRLMAQRGAILETPDLLLQGTAAAQTAELPTKRLCWPPLSLGAQNPGQKAAVQVVLILVAAQAAEQMMEHHWWQPEDLAVQRAGQGVQVVAQAPEWMTERLW